ncbi:hypothetical protein VaNZ11_004492 [Volvox africanus]|uniref:CNH domain-containing protein n=1 Tax=Volvox africanus TaxID=51714 RepID=A0ABQ5RXE3_9CHLO|nr:hypothetical protein VaNZ11_004492 [Volvox africanus]
MSKNNLNACKAIMARELGGRRPGTATSQCRRLYQSILPTNKVQQMEVPEAHICRFSPCGNYLVCLGGGFTQLVVYHLTGPRVSWQGELSEAEIASRLTSFSSFFSLLYRVPLAPVREVIARDVVLFMAGGSLLLLVSHSPFATPAAQPSVVPDADPLQSLPFAESITLHLVRLSDGMRVGGSRLDCELVDLTGRPGNLGISVHEDLIAVLALRSQVVHLLQVLRGGEEVVPVRSLGPYVAEDDELVLRIAAEAEERWLRARRAEREWEEEASACAALPPPLRRCYNGDLVRTTDVDGGQPSTVAAASSSGATRHQSTRPLAAEAGGQIGGLARWSRGPSAQPPRTGSVGPGLDLPLEPGSGEGAGMVSRQTVTSSGGEVLQGVSFRGTMPGAAAHAASDAAVSGVDAGGRVGRAGSGSGSSAVLAPSPVSILHPPERFQPGQGATAGVAAAYGPGSHAAPAADLAAAAAQQTIMRRQMRQQQYEQLAAQGGPGHPPQARRNVPQGGAVRVASNPNQTGQDAAGFVSAPQAPHHNHHQQSNNPPPPLQQQQQQFPVPPRQGHYHHHNRHQHQQQYSGAYPQTAPRQIAVRQQQQAPGPAGPGRVLLPPDGGEGGRGGSNVSGGCILGIKQRLLAHLYMNCRKSYLNNPRRQQREAIALFRHLDTYRSLLMRKVYLLDRSRLLIDMRKPMAAELGQSVFGGGGAHSTSGGGTGQAPSQFFLLFDLHTTRVLGFEASPGDKVIESYLREVTSTAVEPWAESLPLWDRYVYDNVATAVRGKLRGYVRGSGGGDGIGIGIDTAGRLPTAASGGGGAATAAAERASCAGKLMQLLPPLSGSCALSSSPYLDTFLFNYDERVVSPYIRTRPCLEQSIFFRLRNRLDRAVFRLDPGPYEAMMVRDRHLARNVTYLFHPDAPFVMAVFGVFQQNTVNINFRM